MKLVNISIFADISQLTGEEIITFSTFNQPITSFNIKQKVEHELMEKKLNRSFQIEKYGNLIDVCPAWFKENTTDFSNEIDIDFLNIANNSVITYVKIFYTTPEQSYEEYLIEKKEQ
jgi:hypothetical protein